LKACYIASGLRKIPYETAAYGIEDIGENDRDDPRFLEQRGHDWSGACENDI
jgi:hypothetical protein